MIIYNDKKQTIQGVTIPDSRKYSQLKSIISAQHLEGFNPTSADIEHLLTESKKTNTNFNDLYKQLFG